MISFIHYCSMVLDIIWLTFNAVFIVPLLSVYMTVTLTCRTENILIKTLLWLDPRVLRKQFKWASLSHLLENNVLLNTLYTNKYFNSWYLQDKLKEQYRNSIQKFKYESDKKRRIMQSLCRTSLIIPLRQTTK